MAVWGSGLCATLFFLFGFDVAAAAAPTRPPLSPEQIRELCGLGMEADSGNKYVDRLVNLLYEKNGDELRLNVFNPFGTQFANKIGHNIYASAYLKVAKEPVNKALERTAAALGVSGSEVQAVLNGGVDILRSRKRNLTHEEAIKEASNIKDLYQEQVNLGVLEMEIQGYSTPLEIFSDGDIVNSGGFDLLSDLDRIDYLLFYDKAMVSKGADLDFLSPATPEPSPPAPPSPRPSSSLPAVSSSPVAPTPVGATKEGGGRAAALPTPPSPSYQPRPQENPLQCFANGNLNLQAEALSKKALPENLVAKINKQYAADLAADAQGALASGTDITYPVISPPPPPQTDKEEQSIAKQENILCNEWICFEVIANVKQQSLFTDRANCVACHVEKAKESLDATVSKNLVPNKLTGNLMEGAKCKNAAAQVGFPINLITIFNPIKTPPNTNQVGTEFLISYDKLLQTVLGGDYYDPKKGEFVSKLAQVQSQVIKSLPPETPVEEAERQVRAAVTKSQDEAARAFKNALNENNAFNKGDFYQQVSGQIARMNAYFKAMSFSFNDINTNICPQIQNKPACQ